MGAHNNFDEHFNEVFSLLYEREVALTRRLAQESTDTWTRKRIMPELMRIRRALHGFAQIVGNLEERTDMRDYEDAYTLDQDGRYRRAWDARAEIHNTLTRTS